MNSIITEPSDILFELEAVQQFTEEQFDSENINAIVDRCSELAAYITRTGKILADAKYHRDKKLSDEVTDKLKKLIALPASSANKFIDSLCRDENYAVNWAERLNRACTHQLEYGRTLISKAKEEMRTSNFNPS